MTRTGSTSLIGLLLAVVPSLSGCSDDRSLVVIATPWDRATCQQFTTLLAEAPGDSLPPIRWVRLDPWDDPARLLDAGRTVHLLLGWPTATLAALDDRGLLDAVAAGPFRCVVAEGSEPFHVSDSERRVLTILDGDPRIDPVARDQVASLLARSEGQEGYASVILSRSSSPPAEDPASDPEPEGFTVASIAQELPPEARSLLERLRRRSVIESLDSTVSRAVTTLSAELVGATIIDAGTELEHAWEIIEQSPDAAIGRALLGDPPPWPPDSIRSLGNDPSRRSMIETLAAALVDDPESRAWLLKSWQEPSRPVDRALLDALASANEGRLLRSSRVLPWLRAEWTAWARQRYSQIARELRPEAEGAAR